MHFEKSQQKSTGDTTPKKDHGETATDIDEGAFSLLRKKDGSEASKKVLYGAAREAARQSIAEEQKDRNFIHVTGEQSEQEREQRIEDANEKFPQKQKMFFRATMGALSKVAHGVGSFAKEMAKRASAKNVYEAVQEKKSLQKEMEFDVALTERTIRLRQEILQKDAGENSKISLEDVKKYRETLREIQKMKKEEKISHEQFERVIKSLRENKKRKDDLQTAVEQSMASWKKEANIKIAKSLWDTGILWGTAASVGLGASVVVPGTSLAGKMSADTAYRKAALEKKGQESKLLKNVIVEGAIKTLKLSVGVGEGNRAKARADVISYALGAFAAMMPANIHEAISHGEIDKIPSEEVPQINKEVQEVFTPETFDHSSLVQPVEEPAVNTDTTVVGTVVEEGRAQGEVIGDFDPSVIEPTHLEHMTFSQYVVPKGGSLWHVLKEGILSHPDYEALSASEQSNFIMNAFEELKKPQYRELLREQGVDKCLNLHAGEVFSSQELKKLNEIIASFKIDVVTTDGVVKSMSLFERADVLSEDMRNNILEIEDKIAKGEERVKSFCFVCEPSTDSAADLSGKTESVSPEEAYPTTDSGTPKQEELLREINPSTPSPAETSKRTYV